MSKLERVNANVEPFAINSPNGNRYAFGTTDATDNINDNYNENIKKGFGTSPNDFPELEDFNALMFTESYLSGYLYQEGVPEWNDKQKYYVNSITKGSDGELYKSLSGTAENPNVGNNPTIVGSTNWEQMLTSLAKANSYDLGVGQVWQNVTSQRSLGVTYTNNTGKPISVSVSFDATVVGSTFLITVDGKNINNVTISSASGDSSVVAIVPHLSIYRLTQVFQTGGTVVAWHELR